MTNVHRRSTILLGAALSVVLVLGLTVTVQVSRAQGYTIQEIRAKIARLSAQLTAQEARSGALLTQYLTYSGQVQSLDHSIGQLRSQVTQKKKEIGKTQHALVSGVVRSYVDGSSASMNNPLFGSDVTLSDARQVYENTVLGNLNQLESRLLRQKRSLQYSLAKESSERAQSAAAVHQVNTLRAENNANATATRATLAQVSSALAGQIIAYELATAVSAAKHHDSKGVTDAILAATAVGGQDAANRIIAAVAAVTITAVAGTPAGTVDGLRAVAAAESQRGVPYVWGGESPGVGFDCSGLTEWSWARAGHQIPRTAAEQYYAMRHVLLNELRPGDLLFYFNLDNDNQIDHVVMYVGSGPWGTNTIIAASHTGTVISFEPLFVYGLYGAARP